VLASRVEHYSPDTRVPSGQAPERAFGPAPKETTRAHTTDKLS
jgi:hypothetical protein